MRKRSIPALSLCLLVAAACGETVTEPDVAGVAAAKASADNPGAARNNVRFATFNASLNRSNAGDLGAELAVPGSAQPATIAEIIQQDPTRRPADQRVRLRRPGTPRQTFQDNYLSDRSEVGAHADRVPVPVSSRRRTRGSPPASIWTSGAPATCVPNDAFGFGFFPGQFGMVVLLDVSDRHGRGSDLPALPVEGHARRATCPTIPARRTRRLVLCRRSWTCSGCRPRATGTADQIGNKVVHFLTSHPTPPVFDGPRIATGRETTTRSGSGRTTSSRHAPGTSTTTTGCPADCRRVTCSSSPETRTRIRTTGTAPGAAQQLLDHPMINTKVTPDSEGGPEQWPFRAGSTHAPQRSGLRYGRLQRLGPGQPPGRLRASAKEPADPGRGRLLAAEQRSSVLAGGDVPVPVLGPPARVDRREGAGQLAERA